MDKRQSEIISLQLRSLLVKMSWKHWPLIRYVYFGVKKLPIPLISHNLSAVAAILRVHSAMTEGGDGSHGS